jgi:DNA polymerase-3 subunit delta'
VAAAPARLPATIVSRCQRLRVATPTREQSRAWLTGRRGEGPWDEVLEVIGEAPFSALTSDPQGIVAVARETRAALATLSSHPADVERLAGAWAREQYELRLACLETWLTSRIDEAVRRGGQSGELRSGAQLRNAGSDMNMASLLRLLDGLHELVRLRQRPLNRALALEQLLWDIALAGSGREAAARGSVARAGEADRASRRGF